VNVGSGCSTQPFFGFPLTLPGKVEAEDFDLGGEGVGYHDTTGGNNGGAYRPGEDVDLESCSEGGFNVGWMDAGEWLQYTIAVAEPGTYSVQARVASESTGGTFHIEFDGVNGTGNMNVPATGGWQNWVTIGSSLDLSPGIHTMRFVNSNDPDEYNINYFNVTLLYPFGDIDQDGDVDLTDYARYTACLSGPNQTTPPPGCTPVEFDRSDFDSDGDVDARDFAIGQTIMP
jgi:hypothetical protein